MLSFATHTDAGGEKIVFFPMPVGNSPYFIFLKFAEELESRGYQVTDLTGPKLAPEQRLNLGLNPNLKRRTFICNSGQIPSIYIPKI